MQHVRRALFPVQFTEIWCSIAAGEISAMLPEVRTPRIIHHNGDSAGGRVGGELRQGGLPRLGVGDIENTSNKIWMGVIDGINVIGADDPTPVEEYFGDRPARFHGPRRR